MVRLLAWVVFMIAIAWNAIVIITTVLAFIGFILFIIFMALDKSLLWLFAFYFIFAPLMIGNLCISFDTLKDIKYDCDHG